MERGGGGRGGVEGSYRNTKYCSEAKSQPASQSASQPVKVDIRGTKLK